MNRLALSVITTSSPQILACALSVRHQHLQIYVELILAFIIFSIPIKYAQPAQKHQLKTNAHYAQVIISMK
jgi:ABC-type polysaccharide/polyol phosphate export permease